MLRISRTVASYSEFTKQPQFILHSQHLAEDYRVGCETGYDCHLPKEIAATITHKD